MSIANLRKESVNFMGFTIVEFIHAQIVAIEELQKIILEAYLIDEPDEIRLVRNLSVKNKDIQNLILYFGEIELGTVLIQPTPNRNEPNLYSGSLKFSPIGDSQDN